MFDVPKFISSSSIYKSSPEKVKYFEELVSTSDYAKELAKNGAESATLVIADFQSGGRGRGGKSWQSKPSEGLLFSLILEPDIEPKLWYRFSLAAGVAVAKSIEDLSAELNDNIGLKWPNDVHISGKKVAGILTEVSSGKVIIGIGLNISGAALLETATSMMKEGLIANREVLLASIVQEIFKWGSLSGVGYELLISEYQKRCILTGKDISMKSCGKTVTGKVVGIDHEGFIVLEGEIGKNTYLEGHDIKFV